jgi:hypothetical protein
MQVTEESEQNLGLGCVIVRFSLMNSSVLVSSAWSFDITRISLGKPYPGFLRALGRFCLLGFAGAAVQLLKQGRFGEPRPNSGPRRLPFFHHQ